MALILNIETSTTVCSVALATGDSLLALKEEDRGYTHAEKITVFIQDVFEKAGKNISDLDAVAVSSGPGSYTGLRIGTSTAKGLCYALNKPLISVNTLQALAVQVKNISNSDLLCPMIDARRMEVYCALYDSALNEIQPVTAKVIDETSFSNLLKTRKVFFFGDGSAKCKSALSHQSNAIFLDNISCSAASMISLSNQKYISKQFEDTALYEPFYLKEFIGKKST